MMGSSGPKEARCVLFFPQRSSSLHRIKAYGWPAGGGGSMLRKPHGRADHALEIQDLDFRIFWGKLIYCKLKCPVRSTHSNASVFRPTERSILPDSAPAQFAWRLQRGCIRALGETKLLEC